MIDKKSLHYINKQTIRVEIVTERWLIEGFVHVLYNHRASDMLNSKENFVAITDASVCSPENTPLFKKDFIAVNKDYIILLTEKEAENIPNNG